MAHKANTFCRANTILVRRPGLPTNGNPIDKRPQARPIGPRSGPRPIRGLAGPIPSAGPTQFWYDVPGLPPMGIPLKNGHRQGRSALGPALGRSEGRLALPSIRILLKPITRGSIGPRSGPRHLLRHRGAGAYRLLNSFRLPNTCLYAVLHQHTPHVPYTHAPPRRLYQHGGSTGEIVRFKRTREAASSPVHPYRRQETATP